MKFERLLKVPRSARTIQLTINIPETPAPPVRPVQEPKKRKLWNRVWVVLKVGGPVIASIVAIIISTLSLQEQRQVDVTTATANQRIEAERVSFLQESSNPGSSTTPVLLENLGTAPVNSVTLYIQVENDQVKIVPVGTRGDGTGTKSTSFSLPLGSIPACSSATVNIRPYVLVVLDLEKSAFANGTFINVSSMTFSDGNGLYWQYNGQLQQIASPPVINGTVVYFGTASLWDNYTTNLSLSYKSASGCA